MAQLGNRHRTSNIGAFNARRFRRLADTFVPWLFALRLGKVPDLYLCRRHPVDDLLACRRMFRRRIFGRWQACLEYSFSQT